MRGKKAHPNPSKARMSTVHARDAGYGHADEAEEVPACILQRHAQGYECRQMCLGFRVSTGGVSILLVGTSCPHAGSGDSCQRRREIKATLKSY